MSVQGWEGAGSGDGGGKKNRDEAITDIIIDATIINLPWMYSMRRDKSLNKV